ncbi:VOC family protein [Actinoplanes philippinensis]|uniref:VOC family protein n=1 Tax=Actinoplanes philippinensis TaxID=35752 RepID=UPI0033D23446
MTTVRGIDNVLFAVGDLATAVDFYAGRLGLPLAFRMDGAGVALFRLGDETPGLMVRQTPGAARATAGPRLWLEVADARAAAAGLAEAGVAPLAEPFPVATGWTVEVADPWGNVVGFTDYTTMPGRGRG